MNAKTSIVIAALALGTVGTGTVAAYRNGYLDSIVSPAQEFFADNKIESGYASVRRAPYSCEAQVAVDRAHLDTGYLVVSSERSADVYYVGFMGQDRAYSVRVSRIGNPAMFPMHPDAPGVLVGHLYPQSSVIDVDLRGVAGPLTVAPVEILPHRGVKMETTLSFDVPGYCSHQESQR